MHLKSLEQLFIYQSNTLLVKIHYLH